MKIEFSIIKNQGVRLIAINFVLLFSVHAELVTDEAIEFVKADFGGAKSARKAWTINAPAGAATKVWSVQNAGMDDTIGDARLKIGNTAYANSEIVWKIQAPEGGSIRDFQWAVNAVFLQGTANADAKFLWEYSADGRVWNQLFSRQNMRDGEVGPVSILKESYSGKFNRPFPHSFYIRARNEEEVISGNMSYYAIFSAYPDGGESNESFVSITID